MTIKSIQEFYYNNIEIKIIPFFGYIYKFIYAETEYIPLMPYSTTEEARLNAKLHVNEILRKRKERDDMETNV